MDYKRRVFRRLTRKSTTMLVTLDESKTSSTLYEILNEYMNSYLSTSGKLVIMYENVPFLPFFTDSVGADVDEAVALAMQQSELMQYRKTQAVDGPLLLPRPGSRVLCLDGGGIRGLVQLEVYTRA